MEQTLFIDVNKADSDLVHDTANFILQAINVWGSRAEQECKRDTRLDEPTKSDLGIRG